MSYSFYNESRNGASKSIAPNVLRGDNIAGLEFKTNHKSHNTSKQDSSPQAQDYLRKGDREQVSTATGESGLGNQTFSTHNYLLKK